MKIYQPQISGSLAINGEWFNSIKEVKENNPKP